MHTYIHIHANIHTFRQTDRQTHNTTYILLIRQRNTKDSRNLDIALNFPVKKRGNCTNYS